MFRIDDATATTSLPTPETAGTEGYFTEGNPTAGTPATNVRGSWLNMIQEELRALVVYGGLTPSKTVYTQVRDAIVAKFAKLNGDSTQLFSVAPATQSQHAVQMAQLVGLIGQSTNLQLTTSSGTAFTLTADQIIVGTALNGLVYAVNNVSHTFNAATTGLNGMDTGSLPATGAVAIYEVFNPTTGAKGLLGRALASITTVAPSVYGGVNPVAGFTASALVAVLCTASSAFVVTKVLGRKHLLGTTLGIGLIGGTTVSNSTPTAVSITNLPGNAKSVDGYLIASVSAVNTLVTYSLAADANSLGAKEVSGTNAVSGGQIISPVSIDIFTPGTLYYTLSVGSGTGNCGLQPTGYTI